MDGLVLRGDEVGLEVVEEDGAELRRPLGLVGGRGYAATWVRMRVHREVVGAAPAGGRRRLPGAEGRRALTVRAAEVTVGPVERELAALEVVGPAEERRVETRTERRLVVVRDDGAAFGGGMERTLEELGFLVGLAAPAREERLWRWPAVAAYRRGERPDAAGAFGRLVACYDAFVDFDRSLAEQRTCCELCACLSVVTWLSDAFPLVPYLWVTGERGSGKTQLGTVWAETSYLGEVVLGSGSFAALRDAAEQGAALYFDDAEAFGGGRRGDLRKRELLLAGNRRGATAGLKAWGGEGWATRRVAAYAPRAFSSIGLPEATLGSRAIVVPLARTLDAGRGHRDPGEPAAWPCDRAGLRDDLWALGLAWLAKAAEAWRGQGADGELVGREREKWRPVLAVARLLEEAGVVGLEGRMRGVMRGYQGERERLVGDDETAQVVRAVIGALGLAEEGLRNRGVRGEELARLRRKEVPLTTALIAEAMQYLRDSELGTRSKDAGLAKRVGHTMARLRFRATRDRTGNRAWLVSFDRALDLARAYGVFSDEW